MGEPEGAAPEGRRPGPWSWIGAAFGSLVIGVIAGAIAGCELGCYEGMWVMEHTRAQENVLNLDFRPLEVLFTSLTWAVGGGVTGGLLAAVLGCVAGTPKRGLALVTVVAAAAVLLCGPIGRWRNFARGAAALDRQAEAFARQAPAAATAPQRSAPGGMDLLRRKAHVLQYPGSSLDTSCPTIVQKTPDRPEKVVAYYNNFAELRAGMRETPCASDGRRCWEATFPHAGVRAEMSLVWEKDHTEIRLYAVP